VTFAPQDGQSQGWGTILVSGTARFGQDEITGADRGVAALAGSRVTLTGTNLHGNKTGLHVAGVAAVRVDQASITSNTVYGVKEDAGGRPVMTNTTIRNNFRNYYSWDRGLLGIAAVNALGQNIGNTGE